MDAYMFLLCKYSSFTPKMQGRRMGTSGRAIIKSTSVSGEMYTLEHNDGSQSDTAVGTVGAGGKKRRSSLSAKVVAIVSRRSRSTSQLSQTGEYCALHLAHARCAGDARVAVFMPGPETGLCMHSVFSFLCLKKIYWMHGLNFSSVQLTEEGIVC